LDQTNVASIKNSYSQSLSKDLFSGSLQGIIGQIIHFSSIMKYLSFFSIFTDFFKSQEYIISSSLTSRVSTLLNCFFIILISSNILDISFEKRSLFVMSFISSSDFFIFNSKASGLDIFSLANLIYSLAFTKFSLEISFSFVLFVIQTIPEIIKYNKEKEIIAQAKKIIFLIFFDCFDI